jgi:hypothetical protein
MCFLTPLEARLLEPLTLAIEGDILVVREREGSVSGLVNQAALICREKRKLD